MDGHSSSLNNKRMGTYQPELTQKGYVGATWRGGYQLKAQYACITTAGGQLQWDMYMESVTHQMHHAHLMCAVPHFIYKVCGLCQYQASFERLARTACTELLKTPSIMSTT